MAGFLRTRPLVWEFLNKDAKAIYRENPPELDDVQRRVLGALKQDGIALVHLDELFPGTDVFSPLVEHLDRRRHEAEIFEKKPFLEYIYTSGSTIELDNPFIQFSLQRRILDIVNEYIEMCSKLIYFELAISKVLDKDATAAASQRWHRDPGMKKILKTFLYLTDVDESSGPFMYGVGTQLGGPNGKSIRQLQFGRHGFYPEGGVVESTVSPEELKVCTGRAGTLIFADTIGLHRGGFSTGNSRIMYTSTFVAEGDKLKRVFKVPEGFNSQLSALVDPVSRFTLS
jgi:hypothetical protein